MAPRVTGSMDARLPAWLHVWQSARHCPSPDRSGARMASFHLSVKTVKRSAGWSATAAAAYRSASVIECDRDGRMHEYTAKRGVEACFILAPADAPEWAQDRAALWNSVEARETRSKSVTAREWELALPSELSDAARINIARAFAQQLFEHFGVAADVAIHASHREGDQRNHHALELAGQEERVDHRSLEVQRDEALSLGDVPKTEELDHEPELKLGPAANAIERGAQLVAEAEEHDYEPLTQRGARLHAVRQAWAMFAEMRERLELALDAWAEAREVGQSPVSAGLAALRAAAGRQANELNQDAIKQRLARIAGRDLEADEAARGTGENAIHDRLKQVLGQDKPNPRQEQRQELKEERENSENATGI